MLKINCKLNEPFQTKQFNNQLDNYRITSDGKLEKEIVEWVATQREDKPFPDAKPGTPNHIFGSLTIKSKGWVDTRYHGIVIFYTTSENGEWFEFLAKFTDGVLVNIERVPENYSPNYSC